MTIFRFALLLSVTLFSGLRPGRAQQVVAQDLRQQPGQTGEIYTIVEKQPSFPGGEKALQQYIKQHRVYPDIARKAGVSGRVFVSFVINTDGSIQNVELLKGIGMGCDEQAIHLVQTMPNWIPGSQSGKAIRVKYNLPVAFGLAD